MLAAIGAALSLADTVLEFMSHEKKMEFRNKLYSLRSKILDERLKNVSDQDHAALEEWYQKVPVLQEAIELELKLELAKRK